MFTGIVDHCGKIVEAEKMDNGLRMRVQTRFSDFEMGESIAVDGVCLTVSEWEESDFFCELSPETLARTNLDTVRLGSRVNLERSLRMGDRIGGHWVQGHVDEVVSVSHIENQGGFVEMRFSGFSEAGRAYLVKKGSLAINGVSLTLNERWNKGAEVSVMLIPHTLERTNLGTLDVGSQVNIEYDILVRAVIQRLEELGTKL